MRVQSIFHLGSDVEQVVDSAKMYLRSSSKQIWVEWAAFAQFNVVSESGV